RAFFNRDGADRAGLRRFGLGFLIAASCEQGEPKGADERRGGPARRGERADGPARWRKSGGWSQGESSHGRCSRAYRARAGGATIRNAARCALSPRMRSAAVAAAPGAMAAATMTAPVPSAVTSAVAG